MKIIFLVVTWMFFSPAFASQVKVVFVKPPVIVKETGEKARAVQKNETLREGARIQVKKDGLIVLKEGDGSTVKLESGAVFEITRLKKDSKDDSVSVFSLARGAAFFFTPKNTGEDEKMRVRGSTASFAVRGTEFFVAYGEGKGREDDIWMCVNSGVVESLSKESKKPVVVKAGEGIQVNASGAITPPQFLPWTSKLNWNNDPKSGDLKNRVSIEEAYASPLEMDFD